MGSDVPFALLGGTAVGQGRGEQLTAALAAGTYHWVLAFASRRPVHARGLRRLRPAARGACGQPTASGPAAERRS